MLQFKPTDSVVATADYTYTFYKDIVNRHTFGAWFDYATNPTSATINSHGTVTNLVDTGSDLSYFSAADEFINQNGSAGFNLRWDASDNVDVEFDGHHSFANSDGGALGNNNFGIVGQDPCPVAHQDVYSRQHRDSDHQLDLQVALYHQQSRRPRPSTRCSVRRTTICSER